jgi:Mg-chelatase subunit ChlD
MDGEKFEAALAAATAFVRAVRLPADQVGIVSFNRASTVVSALSGDLAALERAIEGIQMAPGTRIDTGLEAARTVLAGPERRADAAPVVVVMTDGIQEAEPERPVDLADGLRADGVALFVIGLGTDVDVAYLERLAAGRDALYLSPAADELVGIYEQLARLIPCPASDYWGGR